MMTFGPSLATAVLVLLVAVVSNTVTPCNAFHHQCIAPSRHVFSSRSRCIVAATAETGDDASDVAAEGTASDAEEKPFDTRVMQMFMEQKYPAFMQLLSDQEIWKELSTGQGGYTIFAPNNKAFDKLGETKLRQLNDPRNLETTEKIGRYHAIAAPVTSKQIYDSSTGGIKTLGGDLPVGKTKKGGFLGFGGEEDGGVTVNGARIVESFEVTNCVVHEVDDLIHLKLLWRYMDQLRIPGT